MKNKIGYLGPKGTFCEAAAIRCNKQGSELVPYPSIESVFAAVNRSEIYAGIVPIENSCEGAVNQTLDLLAYEYSLAISGEIILPVRQNLLTRPKVKTKEISCIISHSQALAQCRQYLSINFADAELIDVTSTAEAARRVAISAEPWAAIGTQEAALTYGLAVITPDIQDNINNETRFIIITQPASVDNTVWQLNYKTSLILYLANKPGALYHTLEQFYSNNINLNKIESRPARTRIGDYLFFIDIEGHQRDSKVMNALKGLEMLVSDIKILGSYPAAI